MVKAPAGYLLPEQHAFDKMLVLSRNARHEAEACKLAWFICLRRFSNVVLKWGTEES